MPVLFQKSIPRGLFLALLAILLSSCINVENFGAYWDKGTIDTALAGDWKKIRVPGEELGSTPGPELLRFEKAGTFYRFLSINPITKDLRLDVAEQRKKDNDDRMRVRTLKIGTRSFMMEHQDNDKAEGILQRYEIHGDVMSEYAVEGDAALELLSAKYPNATNIARARGEGRYIEIHTFDEEVFRALSDMSDPEYWQLVCRYRKVK
jgi:hypothetical protein